jgi:hypothetical protein
MGEKQAESLVEEWVTFPGGELEGKRPKALCRQCREALKAAALNKAAPKRVELKGPAQTSAGWNGAGVGARRALCFQCYRAGLDRDRALRAAGDLDTGSNERFQFQLPFEPLNRPRLERLKVERALARAAVPVHEHARRRGQIEARHMLQQIAVGLKARGLAAADRERAIFQAVHAAELQLPESWIPFVVSR